MANGKRRKRPLGKILLENEYVSEKQLQEGLNILCNLPAESHMHLGEILISLNSITQEQLDHALSQQAKFDNAPIGRILVQEGILKDWELTRALRAHYEEENAKKRLGAIVIDMGFATQEQIEEAIDSYYEKKSAALKAEKEAESQ